MSDTTSPCLECGSRRTVLTTATQLVRLADDPLADTEVGRLECLDCRWVTHTVRFA